MTSMSACISRDNEPNISAPSKILLSASTQQWKTKTAALKGEKKNAIIGDLSTTFSEELVDHSDGSAKKKKKNAYAGLLPLFFLSLLYCLLLQKTAKTRSYLNKYVNLYCILIFELMVKYLRKNALWIQ